MRFLDDEACTAWCEEHGYRTTRSMHGQPMPALRDEMPFTDLAYPADSGRKVALAKAVVGWALRSGPCLIWIVEFGVWPSSEHRPLYDRFRQALGDRGDLGSASGHLVESNDLDDAISVVVLALSFFWDVYVLPEQTATVFFASHDEYAGCYGVSPDALAAWLPGETG